MPGHTLLGTIWSSQFTEHIKLELVLCKYESSSFYGKSTCNFLDQWQGGASIQFYMHTAYKTGILYKNRFMKSHSQRRDCREGEEKKKKKVTQTWEPLSGTRLPLKGIHPLLGDTEWCCCKSFLILNFTLQCQTVLSVLKGALQSVCKLCIQTQTKANQAHEI